MNSLPPVLAGPVLRRIEPGRLCLWLVTSIRVELSLELYAGTDKQQQFLLKAIEDYRHLAVGESMHYYLIDLSLQQVLPSGRLLRYNLLLKSTQAENAEWTSWRDWAPELCF